MASKYKKSNKQPGNTPYSTAKNIKYKYKMMLGAARSLSDDSKHFRSKNKVYIKENARKVTSARDPLALKARSTPRRRRSTSGVNASTKYCTTKAMKASTNHRLIKVPSVVRKHKFVNISKSPVNYRLIRATQASTKHKLVGSTRSSKYKLACSSARKQRLAGRITKYRLVRTSNSAKCKLLSSSNPSAKYRLVAASSLARYNLVSSNKSTKYKLVTPRTLARYNLIVGKSARHSLKLRKKGGSALYQVTSIGGIGTTWNRNAAQGGRNKYRYRISQNMTKLGSRKILHTPGRYHYTRNLTNVSGGSCSTSRSRVAASQVLQKTKCFLMMQRKKSSQLCLFYTKFGKCSSKDKRGCPYKHDPQKVAVCRRFLSGKCQDNDCLLSHEVAPEKMPTCTFFLRGVCVKENCPYLHVKVNPNAEVCKDFVDGYCPKGVECHLKHELKPLEKVKPSKRKPKKLKADVSEASDEPRDEEDVVDEPVPRYYNVKEETYDGKREGEETTTILTVKKRRLSGSLPSYIPLNQYT